KTHSVYFKAKMSQSDQSTLKFMDKQINSTYCIDFLGVTLDSTFWQGHITRVITKLNSACSAIRTLKLFLTIENLRMVYFAYKNTSKFVISMEVYTINTRQSINLYLPSVNLSKCKRGPYFMGIKIFNHFPRDIRKLLYDVNKFKVVTKNFFLQESFYSINEYFEWSDK
ncbi:hypothetical protein B7P43_G06414, partial [Cryptotermes secundus]